jgi:hypothetical protein
MTPQTLFENLDFQLRPVEFALQRCDAEMGIDNGHRR